jgi:hypothetical protein
MHAPAVSVHFRLSDLHCPRLGGLKPSPLGDGFSKRAVGESGEMAKYGQGAHTGFGIHLHVAFTTKPCAAGRGEAGSVKGARTLRVYGASANTLDGFRPALP